MKAEEAIKIIESAIIGVKEQNQDTVSVDALLKYLTSLKEDVKNAQAFDQEKYESNFALLRTAHERNLTHYNAQQQYSLEMLRSVTTYGQEALKSAILINGSAAVALLAFIGNIWIKSTGQLSVHSITKAIVLFAFGVVTAAIGTGTTYVTQYCYSKKWEKTAILFHIVTIIVVLVAYALFCFGSYDAYSAFVEHLTPKK